MRLETSRGATSDDRLRRRGGAQQAQGALDHGFGTISVDRMSRSRDLFEGEGGCAAPVDGKVVCGVERVLVGSEDVDGSGERTELVSELPVLVVFEGSPDDVDGGCEQRRSFVVGVLPTPVGMVGQ